MFNLLKDIVQESTKNIRLKRLVPVTARNSRDELIRRGWIMRGAWAERRIGKIRLVLSGNVDVNGVPYRYLSFHSEFDNQTQMTQVKTVSPNLFVTKFGGDADLKEEDKSFLTKNEEYGDGFSASLMNGPSVDLFEIAGYEWTPELNDAVWGDYNWKSLLEECGSIEIIEVEEHDEIPGMSDAYYWVAVDDEEKFKEELRGMISSIIKEY